MLQSSHAPINLGHLLLLFMALPRFLCTIWPSWLTCAIEPPCSNPTKKTDTRWCPPSYKVVYNPKNHRYNPLINHSVIVLITPTERNSELGHHLARLFRPKRRDLLSFSRVATRRCTSTHKLVAIDHGSYRSTINPAVIEDMFIKPNWGTTLYYMEVSIVMGVPPKMNGFIRENPKNEWFIRDNPVNGWFRGTPITFGNPPQKPLQKTQLHSSTLRRGLRGSTGAPGGPGCAPLPWRARTRQPPPGRDCWSIEPFLWRLLGPMSFWSKATPQKKRERQNPTKLVVKSFLSFLAVNIYIYIYIYIYLYSESPWLRGLGGQNLIANGGKWNSFYWP